ncbi:MAG: ATP-binding protein [Oscillospiraceae bacterium]|nr:ATP-binding protein [Oscillospiraceae bacterium]MDD4413543.1 ATP-binding protein [Oscillospiraceae bacterium]
MITSVSQNEKAIGYISMGSLKDDVKALKIDNAEATVENIWLYFDYITGAMNEGLIILGDKGTVLTANNSAISIFGDSVGKSYLELYRDIKYIKAVESALSGKPLSVKISIGGKIYQLSANPVESNLKSYAAVLIDDIIKLSRLDEANIIQEFEEVELSELCKSIISDLSDKAKNKNVTFSFDGVPAKINGYRTILHEMIYNLCDNAINYNKENGSVIVKLLSENDSVVLSVSDTGLGIAPEHQERIFERFYRVDKSHSKDTGGTGLGLSIVKHAALLHDAKITLESQVNSGTTITITFKK